MLDSMLVQKCFHLGVLELRAIVTPHFDQVHLPFILDSYNEVLELLVNLCLVLQKEHPSIARKIINNNKAILVTSQALIGSWTEVVNVDELERSGGCHEILWTMGRSNLFVGLT